MERKLKHNTKITAILISMFIITQLIGLFVTSVYTNGLKLPYGMEPPREIKEQPRGFEIILAFLIALTLFFVLVKINAETFIRLWFFLVTILALALSLNAIFFKLNLFYYSVLALMLAIALSYIKIFKKHLLTHNITELLIYPGIAAVFIPLINVFWIIILLLLISIYDIWAVWHSKIMQKMAKFQINNLKFFTGFFVPYADKKQWDKIKEIKQKYVNKPALIERHFKKSRIRINLAILGGGDIIFPIITSGVFYKYFGLVESLIIMFCAIISLLLLFVMAKKGKFYPAMPFITIGLYLGIIISWLVG